MGFLLFVFVFSYLKSFFVYVVCVVFKQSFVVVSLAMQYRL